MRRPPRHTHFLPTTCHRDAIPRDREAIRRDIRHLEHFNQHNTFDKTVAVAVDVDVDVAVAVVGAVAVGVAVAVGSGFASLDPDSISSQYIQPLDWGRFRTIRETDNNVSEEANVKSADPGACGGDLLGKGTESSLVGALVDRSGLVVLNFFGQKLVSRTAVYPS